MNVDVYRNLTSGLWSVRARDVGVRVIAYGQAVFVEDAQFVIQHGARRAAIESGHRNVHAFVRGSLSTIHDAIVTPTGQDLDDLPLDYHAPTQLCTVPVTYDPFNHTQFVDKDTDQYITGAKYVWLTADKQAFCYQPQYALDITIDA